MIRKNGNAGRPDRVVNVFSRSDFKLENDESTMSASHNDGCFSTARNAAAPPIEIPKIISGMPVTHGLFAFTHSTTTGMSLYS